LDKPFNRRVDTFEPPDDGRLWWWGVAAFSVSSTARELQKTKGKQMRQGDFWHNLPNENSLADALFLDQFVEQLAQFCFSSRERLPTSGRRPILAPKPPPGSGVLP
jgi:hypothetical protein